MKHDGGESAPLNATATEAENCHGAARCTRSWGLLRVFRPLTLLSMQFELDIGAAHFRTPDHMPRLHVMTFNLKTGEATRTRVHSTVGDFPQSPGHMLGALLSRPSSVLWATMESFCSGGGHCCLSNVKTAYSMLWV
jgi:hypothetical protein